MAELKAEYLFELSAEVDFEGVQDVGASPRGTLRIYRVTGGAVNGPKIKGEVLDGGGDWMRPRPDDARDLDVRLTIRTDDGHIIYMQYRGISYVSPEVAERRSRGERVDPSEIYVRTTPVFETSSEKYGWLNRIVAVGYGKGVPGKAVYDVYALL